MSSGPLGAFGRDRARSAQLSFGGGEPRSSAEPLARVERELQCQIGGSPRFRREIKVAEQCVREAQRVGPPREETGVELPERAHGFAEELGGRPWCAAPERDLAEPECGSASHQGHVARHPFVERRAHQRLGLVELSDPLLRERHTGGELTERDWEVLDALRNQLHGLRNAREGRLGLSHRRQRRQQAEVGVHAVHGGPPGIGHCAFRLFRGFADASGEQQHRRGVRGQLELARLVVGERGRSFEQGDRVVGPSERPREVVGAQDDGANSVGRRQCVDIDVGEQRLRVGRALGELVHLRQHVDGLEARPPFVRLTCQALRQSGVGMNAQPCRGGEALGLDGSARVELPGHDAQQFRVISSIAVAVAVSVDGICERAQQPSPFWVRKRVPKHVADKRMAQPGAELAVRGLGFDEVLRHEPLRRSR